MKKIIVTLDNFHKLTFIRDLLSNKNIKIGQSHQYNLIKVEIFLIYNVNHVPKSKIILNKNNNSNKISISLIQRKIIIIKDTFKLKHKEFYKINLIKHPELMLKEEK